MSDDDRSVGWYLTHPAAVVALAVSAFQPDAVLGLLATGWSTVGHLLATWFPVVSILPTLGGAFGFLPAGLLQQLFYVVAAAYVLYLGARAVRRTLTVIKS